MGCGASVETPNEIAGGGNNNVQPPPPADDWYVDDSIRNNDTVITDNRADSEDQGGEGHLVNDGDNDDRGNDNIEPEPELAQPKPEPELKPEPKPEPKPQPKPQPKPKPEHKPEPVEIADFNSVQYTQTTVGTFEAFCDFRQNGEPFEDEDRPSVQPGELWVDEEYPLQVAIKESSRGNIGWKRPFEFIKNPVLFSEGTTRFDIGQGSAGTCWFLSMVANISERTELLERVIPKDAYRVNTQEYDGIFHCKFWRFGQWDNVYIDDLLPVVYDTQLWGAKSTTDDNEMWVALLEKAFGRSYGSYNQIYGGQPGGAYLSLTGGVEEYDEVMGLVGGHAYSLNGTTLAKTNNGDSVQLIRVRNPWGHTEWNGAWSDGSAEWQLIPQGSVNNPNKDDGEFWVCLDDFLQYFSDLTICSLTPDVDCDGSVDCLIYVMNVYGDWVGDTAAGFQNRINNPRYVFDISDEGMTPEGTVPFVVQIIQRTIKRKAESFSIRCDLYRVLGEKTSEKSYIVEMVGGDETNVYTPAVQSTHRHHIKPGRFVVVPSTIEAGQENEYLLRLFSVSPLSDVRQVPKDCTVMACDQELFVQYKDVQVPLDFCQTIFGEWKQGVNAGGQISNQETFNTNPQFCFQIPETGQLEPVVFHLMQAQTSEKLAVGFRVFHYDGIAPLPLNISYIYNQYEKCAADLKGAQGQFVLTWDLDGKYMLPSGDYVLIIHMDKPTDEKKFSLVVKSRIQLPITSYNMSE